MIFLFFLFSYRIVNESFKVEPNPEIAMALRNIKTLIFYKNVNGSTIQELSIRYGISIPSIRSSNMLDPEVIPHWSRINGRSLKLSNVDGMIYYVKSATLGRLAKTFGVDIKKIADANNLPTYPDLLIENMYVVIPGYYRRFPVYIYPVSISYISSNFGMRRHPIFGDWRFHSGMDIPKPYGEPVRASRSGYVKFAGYNGGYGKLVILKHPDGYETWYGHLSKIYVKEGQYVLRGKVIGRVGDTGYTTGPHLHFEFRTPSGKPINPKNITKHRRKS
ncbi:MAG: LysM peptidoglycan-binding domain-containing M23 family metallopeptidase [bacterium]|nr:LysM peptidoglycan-binding domain-containing M23 family metallopeptidase [bacterium]